MVAGGARVLWAGAHGGGGRPPRALLWDGMGRSFRTRRWWVLGYPERCSGLVCGVPLGHGVEGGEERIGAGKA